MNTHADHVSRHNKAVYRVHDDALKSRRCDGCGEVICCMYGQKSVVAPDAPGGVWLLHPECAARGGKGTES